MSFVLRARRWLWLGLGLMLAGCGGSSRSAGVAPPRARATALYGDLNGNGVIDAADATRVLRVVVGLDQAPSNLASMDLNGNGLIDAADATKLLRVVVGLDARLASLTVSPSGVSVAPGATQQFAATVDGQASTAVTWSAVGGTISATGLLTVPSAAVVGSTVTVTATSTADGTLKQSVVVTVARGRAAWTVLLFIDGDNNLEPWAWVNEDQLEQLPDNPRVNLVAQMKTLHGFPQSTTGRPRARRFAIHHSATRNSYASTKLATEATGGAASDLGNLDMGTVATMQDFIAWAQTNYPADHYAIDLWDHGSGWRPVGRAAGARGRGILYSDTYASYLHNEQMAAALAAPTPFDIVFMDACNMQMAEVAYELRNVTTYTVGGEDATPDEGYPYHQILAPLLADAGRTPAQVASDIVTQYTAHPPTSTNSLTQSALLTSALPNLVTAIADYASLLRTKDATFHATIATARTNTVSYDGGDPTDYEGVRDLVDFVNRVSSGTGDPQLTTAGNAVATAVSQALLVESHTGNETGSHGLAIYLPSNSTRYTDAWSLLRGSYALSGFGTASGWAAWLDKFYGLK